MYGNDHDATRSRPHEVSPSFISFFPLSWVNNSWLLRAKVLTSTLELPNLYHENTTFPHPHLRKDQPSGLLDPVKLRSTLWDTVRLSLREGFTNGVDDEIRTHAGLTQRLKKNSRSAFWTHGSGEAPVYTLGHHSY